MYNLFHGNTRVTRPWSHGHIYNIIYDLCSNFVDDVMNRNYNIIIFISNYSYFKETWSRVAKFADVIKYAIMLIKTK